MQQEEEEDKEEEEKEEQEEEEEEERRRSEKREGSETICKIILSASPRRNSSRCKNEYIVADPRQKRDFFFCTWKNLSMAKILYGLITDRVVRYCCQNC